MLIFLIGEKLFYIGQDLNRYMNGWVLTSLYKSSIRSYIINTKKFIKRKKEREKFITNSKLNKKFMKRRETRRSTRGEVLLTFLSTYLPTNI